MSTKSVYKNPFLNYIPIQQNKYFENENIVMYYLNTKMPEFGNKFFKRCNKTSIGKMINLYHTLGLIYHILGLGVSII